MRLRRLDVVAGCAAALILVGAAVYQHVRAATTLLPPGQQCFQTSAGPVSSGSINMYIPGTTTPKATWQDSGQVSQNTQPIQLDANGCAVIFGVGAYRQQLYTGPVAGGLTTGNLVFDLITTDTSAFNQTFWAGQATGTPNNISVTDPGWNSTPGVVLNFKAIATNTGPVTITILPSGFTAPLVVDGGPGPAPLGGGEVVQSNIPRIIFDNVSNSFHLTNSATGGGGGAAGVPIGAEVSCPGFNPPPGFVHEFGQLLSRATFAALFAQVTTSQAGTTTSGSPIVAGLTDTSQFAAGMAVEGPGVPAATHIASVDSGTQIHLSANATASGSGLVTFFAYGNGDGASTFGIPDRRGKLVYGRDNMGGTSAGTLSSTYTTNSPNALGQAMQSPARVGGGGIAIAQGYLPAVGLGVGISGGQGFHSHGVSDPGHIHGLGGGSIIGTSNVTSTFSTGGSGPVSFVLGAANLSILNHATGISIVADSIPAMSGVTNPMGSGVPISAMSVGTTTNWCLRAQ